MIYGTDETFSLFKEGDQQAFKLVYKHLAKTLLWYSMKRTFSEMDSEDIVAACFIKLYHNRQTFESFDNIRRWMFVIVKNASIDFIRGEQKKNKIFVPLTEYENQTFERDANMEMLKYSLLQSLSEHIEKLPKQRKSVIIMSFIQGKDTREIANILRLDTQTVLNHKTRGLAMLKKLIPYNEYTIY